ncbi:MAG: molybdate ABC transporter substrate-binding protein [Bryobacteraceae bacterium]
MVAYTRHALLAPWRSIFSLLVALCVVAPGAAWAKEEVLIAAASNLTAAFQAMGPKFEAETGIHPVFNFGSTAQLARQIQNGAPMDVFAAADEEHVRELEAAHLLVPGSVAEYAQGALALWVPPGTAAAPVLRRLEDLTQPQVRVIAVANPKLAPYGAAAIEALKQAKVWDQLKARVVYGENINMVRQYGASGNADAVFTAYPLVMQERGTVIRVDARLYTPIRQALGIIAGSKNASSARRFVEYLLRGGGRDVLKNFGYSTPAR